jgi:hypothetical protein
MIVMSAASTLADPASRIQPYALNPRHWQYNGSPVLLLGGTVKDCLFQIPDLKAHLDLLRSVGGNYVRNTMSDRPTDGYEIKAFARDESGLYDLNRWNEAYWSRFEDLLRWTAERGIVVQIELWDRFDHSRDPWREDPFNPGNNINYSVEESGLALAYPAHPGRNEQPFFYTVPGLDDNQVVLPYQQAFIDRVLTLSLTADHVLYCMDNETSGSSEWSRYWCEFVRSRAREAGVAIQTTEMWDDWDVTGKTHAATYDQPELYSFIDISQNSWQTGQTNWDHAQHVRAHIKAAPRPINSTKIYGADTHTRYDRGISATHAQQTFWRNLIGGFASSRFHRPPHGLGLSQAAQTHLRSARMLADTFDFFRAEPDAGSVLMSDRTPNEAYLTRIPGEQYAVYFPDGGQVALNLDRESSRLAATWLDIDTSTWHSVDPVQGGGTVELACPGPGQWVALLTVEP